MTEVFNFTDGITGATTLSGASSTQNASFSGDLTAGGDPGPPAGGTPFAVGTAITRPATRQDIFDEIRAGFTDAGWTEYAKVADHDYVFESSGESGEDSIAVRLCHGPAAWSGSSSTDVRYIYFDVDVKLDASNNITKGMLRGSAHSNHGQRWDLTSSNFLADMWIQANLDFLRVMIRRETHNADTWYAVAGIAERTPENQVLYVLQNSPSAGDFVELDFTGEGNPLTDGFKIGDYFSLVQIVKANAAMAEQCLITAVSSTSITVRTLQNSWLTGALCGYMPAPHFRRVRTEANGDDRSLMYFDGHNLNRTSMYSRDGPDADDDMGQTVSFRTPFHGGELGSGNTPDKRVRRFGAVAYRMYGEGGEEIGIYPRYYGYNATIVHFPADTGRWDRGSTDKHFLGSHAYVTTAPVMYGPIT